jgi:hypothetical protein
LEEALITDFWISTAGSTPEFPIVHLARCLNARFAQRNGQITEAQAEGVESLVENLEEDFYNLGVELAREDIRWCPDCFPGKTKRKNLSEAQHVLIPADDEDEDGIGPPLPKEEKKLDSPEEAVLDLIPAADKEPSKSKSSTRRESDTRKNKKRNKRTKEAAMSQAKRKPVVGTVDKHTTGGKSRVLLPTNGEITGSFYLNGTVAMGTEVRVSITLPEFEAPQGDDQGE